MVSAIARRRTTGLGEGITMKTIKGKSGNTYLFVKLPNGSYRAYLEVRRDDASMDCGAQKSTISKMCKAIMGV